MRIAVALQFDAGMDASGRLLVFAEPATGENMTNDTVDVARGGNVAVAARDVTGFGARGSVTIDGQTEAFPERFATLAPGTYRVQAVLDRNGDYNFAGRGPGDLVSKVVTLQFPLSSTPVLHLDHAVPPETDQFDITGLPPVAAAQIAASRPHLHDERIPSKMLTRFRGASQAVAAWVLTPPGYDPSSRATYPTVYTAGAFGTGHKLAGQQLSRMWHLMETGAMPPMIWVALDHSSPTGTTEFADSVNNGPWGEALVDEVIPALEAKYRMDAKPSGRFLTGHSSGGWFALWAIVRYPQRFGGSWATAPGPVDFHDFLGVDLYAPGSNLYRAADGKPRPLERDHDKVLGTIKQAARLERVLGHRGGQLRSFEWVFSPRRGDGEPAFLFDRNTGAVDPAVAAYWRARYDIAHRIEADWSRLGRHLNGKVHVVVGTADSYYLDDPVRRLDAAFRKVGGRADIRYVPGATHSMSMLYAKNGDPNALWKEMSRAMYAVARPGQMWSAPPRTIVRASAPAMIRRSS
ncbi:alpha/beta hydrolase-fold protein [Sphingomonas desiccabilis]|uniref:Enterochelin esterase n=1 Tax=Sphingomonas desiccabilis TaxID=429134 RepID=A0A4Q2IPE6_9SPHN|nr:alpha/beta hydrolase-fold protein [Sphingomonas desiccabilis]MBB3911868.1 enterochelin esterase-like enzyme [Sphingomonas desiccabilis]RXZ31422.1 enterochelin esterase [Sphingomonas desiccabilis]